MKKIVALVLCLALALSLCSMAFAADKADATYWDDKDQKIANKVEYFKASDYEAGEANTLEYYMINGEYYVVGNDVQLWENGLKKANVKLDEDAVELEKDLTYFFKAEKFGETKWSCYTDGVKADLVAYDEDGDPVYFNEKASDKTGEAINVLVKGKVVEAYLLNADQIIEAQHLLIVKGDDGSSPMDTDVLGVYEAYCVACKKTLQISEYEVNGAGYLYSKDADILVDEGYFVFGPETNRQKVAIPSGYTALEGAWLILNDKAPAASGTTIESAKTFDAGIALYAGMALASVAGSAVVIGKKKEF